MLMGRRSLESPGRIRELQEDSGRRKPRELTEESSGDGAAFPLKGFLCVPFPFQETFTVGRPGTAQHHGDSRVGDRRGRGCETLMQPIKPIPSCKGLLTPDRGLSITAPVTGNPTAKLLAKSPPPALLATSLHTASLPISWASFNPRSHIPQSRN